MKARLAPGQVEEIRASAKSSGVLASRYGVSATRICQIRQGDAYLARNREANRKWREAPDNRAVTRQASRRWRQQNLERAREAARESSRRWRAENPRKNSEQDRERSREASRRYRAENPEKNSETSLRWARENPAKALAKVVKRHALKRRVTVGDMEAIAAVYDRAKSASRVRCAYCGMYPKVGDRHVDHRTPLCRGGAHSAENLCVACSSCNLAKGRMTAEEYALACEGRGA
ncbi:MAG: HNH endonuclease [Acidobacteriia bacterium]|nr:HNH endonuclease [Terriglobia bacterium]